MQVFGKDSVLNLGAHETAESREQWLEDVDMKVDGYLKPWNTRTVVEKIKHKNWTDAEVGS